MIIFFKYNNDNNPFQIIRLTPIMPLNGLSQIGGLITIFGLMKIGLWLYNKRSFERKILKELKKVLAKELKKEIDNDIKSDREVLGDLVYFDKVKSPLKSYLASKGKAEFDMSSLRELMSYEMFMILAINYLRKKKRKRREMMNRTMEIKPHKEYDLEINLFDLHAKRTTSE